MPPLQCLKPVVGKRPRVLVLGTMPGPKSLELRQYYANPGNHFWTIMSDITECGGRDVLYEKRCARLKKARVALWDVLEECEREGAADHRISAVEPNDIRKFLKRYPTIKLIALNGRKAEKLFKKHNTELGRPVVVVGLPSTSGANAGISMAKKKKDWAQIGRRL